MRTEEEVRELYKQYVYRYAIAYLDKQEEKRNQFFGASIALGRTLGKDGKSVGRDYLLAIDFINRLRKEGKNLPGYKEV